jgi:hypothetical protein
MKNSWIENPNDETCSIASFIHNFFYFWKILKSQFLVEFQSFVFWHIWAEFIALTVAGSMPKERLKS